MFPYKIYILLAVIFVSSIIILEVNAIYGGEYATSIFPYMVYITFKQRYVCGGAILDEYHVVTSAQCIKRSSKSSHYKVVSETFTTEPQKGKSHAVQRAWVHAKFRMEGKLPRDDIGILTLQQPFVMGTKTHAIPLPPSSVLPRSRHTCVLTGYGNCNQYKHHIRGLKYLIMSLTNQDMCRSVVQLQWNKELGEEHLCMEHEIKQQPTGASRGDLGSVLTCNGFLTGIVSVPLVDSEALMPDIYTKPVLYRDLFEEIKRREKLMAQNIYSHPVCPISREFEFRCTIQQYECIENEYFAALQARWERNGIYTIDLQQQHHEYQYLGDYQNQPSTSQQQPSTSQQQPSTSQQQPSISQQQPSTSQQQPSTSQQQPSTSQQQPSTLQQEETAHQHSTLQQRPSTVQQEDTAYQHSRSQQPSTSQPYSASQQHHETQDIRANIRQNNNQGQSGTRKRPSEKEELVANSKRFCVSADNIHTDSTGHYRIQPSAYSSVAHSSGVHRNNMATAICRRDEDLDFFNFLVADKKSTSAWYKESEGPRETVSHESAQSSLWQNDPRRPPEDSSSESSDDSETYQIPDSLRPQEDISQPSAAGLQVGSSQSSSSGSQQSFPHVNPSTWQRDSPSGYKGDTESTSSGSQQGSTDPNLLKTPQQTPADKINEPDKQSDYLDLENPLSPFMTRAEFTPP